MAEFNQELYEVGSRIVARREELGMTATTLAIQAGISARTLSQIESGQRAAKIDTMMAIADALKVSLDYIQAKKLDQYICVPKGLEALLPKLNAKSPEEQKKIFQVLSTMIDVM